MAMVSGIAEMIADIGTAAIDTETEGMTVIMVVMAVKN